MVRKYEDDTIPKVDSPIPPTDRPPRMVEDLDPVPPTNRATVRSVGVQFTATMPPYSEGAVYVFPKFGMRAELVSWEGPMMIYWMGELKAAPGFRPEEPLTKMGRLYLKGDPICFVVRNPSADVVTARLQVEGSLA